MLNKNWNLISRLVLTFRRHMAAREYEAAAKTFFQAFKVSHR